MCVTFLWLYIVVDFFPADLSVVRCWGMGYCDSGTCVYICRVCATCAGRCELAEEVIKLDQFIIDSWAKPEKLQLNKW